jgi:acylphosphatase
MAGRSEPQPPQGGAVRFEIEGRVQGVGFRYFVRREARRLGIAGWVRNLPNGSVEVLAEGPEGALAALERSLGTGPAGARVDRVRREKADEPGLAHDFEIRG